VAVRRLAQTQPETFAFTPETRAKAEWWMKKYPEGRTRSAVIPLLWLIQKQDGWVSEPAIREVAALLGMPVIRVLEVATFYTMFQLEPVGTRALIQVCGTTPCMLRGANEVMKVCKDKIGQKDHLSADGLFTWQEVECLGACCNAPMAQINDYYYEDLTPETMAQIIDDFRAGKAPQPGSYVGRRSSEPEGGAMTLLDPALYDGSAGKKIDKLPNLPAPPAPAEPAPVA
jgi:NADH-quinone oxidoreductase subunit E